MRKRTFTTMLLALLLAACSTAEPDTADAFDRYVTESNAQIGGALCDGFDDVGVSITMDLWLVTMADELESGADGQALGQVSTEAIAQECPQYLPDLKAWALSL